MSLFNFPVAAWNKLTSTVEGLRKQAPAARMVGEFAVKHLASEANKKISDITQPNGMQRPSNEDSAQ